MHENLVSLRDEALQTLAAAPMPTLWKPGVCAI